MGKDTGFLDYERMDCLAESSLTRTNHFNEFYEELTPEQRQIQAARCMNCGVPYCHETIVLKGMTTGCPLHNLIPEFNHALYLGQYEMAYRRLNKTNPFAEFTGRVCPSLCEKSCLNGVDGQPVTIHDNERWIIENAWLNGWVTPAKPDSLTGKRVAIIGSGPAGLSAAHYLRLRGHDVTVYEKDSRPGGLLQYGIPNMKLDKTIVDRRIQLMKEAGIHFQCDTTVGQDISVERLEQDYDAILMAVGAKEPRDIQPKHQTIQGVWFAVDFLSQVTAHLQDGKDLVSCENEDVVIVGGGDTGNDCVGTALRQKAKSVCQLELMPQPPKTRLESNPWPEWPKIEKTDYGQQEAITQAGQDPRIYQTTIKELACENDTLKEIITVQVQFKDGQLVEIEGSEKRLPCSLLLIAAGFTGVSQQVRKDFDLPLSARGVIEAKDYHVRDHYFVAGDARRGQSLVVWAIQEGKLAARSIDTYLMGYSSIQ